MAEISLDPYHDQPTQTVQLPLLHDDKHLKNKDSGKACWTLLAILQQVACE